MGDSQVIFGMWTANPSIVMTVTMGGLGLYALYVWRESMHMQQRIEMIRGMTALVCSLTTVATATSAASSERRRRVENG